MTPDQAIEYALSEEGDDPPAAVAVPEKQQPAHRPTERLTRREREVILLVERGLINRRTLPGSHSKCIIPFARRLKVPLPERRGLGRPFPHPLEIE
jgi:hypothetical protein